MKKKGDKVTISGFEAIEINQLDEKTASRVSYTMKDGTKFWIVVPHELIIKREERL